LRLRDVLRRKLEMSLDDARRLYLFITLRSLVSAAIRLSICGPMQGQRLQADVASQCIEPLLSSPAIRAQLAPRPREDDVNSSLSLSRSCTRSRACTNFSRVFFRPSHRYCLSSLARSLSHFLLLCFLILPTPRAPAMSFLLLFL